MSLSCYQLRDLRHHLDFYIKSSATLWRQANSCFNRLGPDSWPVADLTEHFLSPHSRSRSALRTPDAVAIGTVHRSCIFTMFWRPTVCIWTKQLFISYYIVNNKNLKPFSTFIYYRRYKDWKECGRRRHGELFVLSFLILHSFLPFCIRNITWNIRNFRMENILVCMYYYAT